ncbi:hypothetical protein MAM1_0026c02151 [Mucor ambiguus]|uniref:Uncharacterized protein n=1 Tax=Mucor ambiguus TaxID=91626 RepID=A0A0C9LSD3_9FUNG|nr:hypothetical protein MAM1_0026c02151 [Mucor ambiguus]
MIQSTEVIETTIKALGHVSMILNIATIVSFEDENEGDDNDTANAVETKVINGHVEQEPTDDVVLSPTAKYSETWIRLRHDFSR